MTDPPPVRQSAVSSEDLRKLGIAACLLALLLPFCVVVIPPMTDLPQQTAQIRLLGQPDLVEGSEYRIGWWHPNKLGYLPLAVGFFSTFFFDLQIHAARIGAALIALSWFVAIFWVARREDRSFAAAAVALLFVWNNSLYWGFLNFLVGMPLFLLWTTGPSPPNPLSRTERGETRLFRLPLSRFGRGGWGMRALLALALYSAHILWFAVALLQTALETLLVRRDPRLFIKRLLPATPALGLVALWAPSFLGAGVDERTFYGPLPWERLAAPNWLVTSALGGVRGMLEPTVLIVVGVWLLLGLAQSRGRGVDPRLLRAGLLLLALAFLLPSVHRHTILFASRWLPAACVLLVLAMPAPKAPRILPGLVAVSLWLVVSLTTSTIWIGFERQELEGFREAIDFQHEKHIYHRVLGLDFVRESPRIRGYPYYHLVAYAQVNRGGELGRSFADEASSLVSWRVLPREEPWTPRLDWKPQGLRHSDLDHFSALLVHGDEALHRRFLADPRLDPVPSEAPWRLYYVQGRID